MGVTSRRDPVKKQQTRAKPANEIEYAAPQYKLKTQHNHKRNFWITTKNATSCNNSIAHRKPNPDNGCYQHNLNNLFTT